MLGASWFLTIGTDRRSQTDRLVSDNQTGIASGTVGQVVIR